MKKPKSVPRPKFENTRKAQRKQKRQQKKIHRQEHYLKKKIVEIQPKEVTGKYVKRPAESMELETEPKKKKSKVLPSAQDILSKEREKERNAANKLKLQIETQRKKMLLQANEEEDKVIRKLEKRLGLKKSKNKNNFFSNDGLDYLLEICDKSTTEQIVAAEKHLAEVEGESDFEEDLAAVTGKDIDNKKDKSSKKKQNDDDFSELNESDDIDDEDGEIGDEIDTEDDVESDGEFDSEVSEEESEVSNTSEEKLSTFDKQKGNKFPQSHNKDEVKTKNNKNEKKTIIEKVISEEDLSKVFSDDEISHLSGDDTVGDLSGDESEINVKVDEKPDEWEDIYGRKRDKEGNIIKEVKGTYIPPHLRNKDSISDKDLVLLKRQVKSVLNKLAGTNLHWACTSIEKLYSSNSRNSVNSALMQVWSEGTVSLSVTPDRMVGEHAALLAVTHANVGAEIGAHFLQELAKRFDVMMQTAQPVEDKRLDNLVSCLAHLYSFKIYHATLLYDILARLLEEITEKTIECVIVALRIVGGVLRKEEPLALKNFVQETQAKVAGMNEKAADGTRVKFLLEVLMAVKNNNLTKIPNYDPTYTEHLKKSIRSIIRKGNYITALNIRLEDLLKADERGKWWVVGSAWEGNHTRPDDKPAVELQTSTDQKLLELARKQRMNTDVRRSIFCVIMSAEDYMDAFEKLQHLGLKGQQEREIVHVLLACCLQERTYNPYYAVLAQKLCDYDRKYQLSIQFSVWDKIKDIENLSNQSATNLAQLLVHLIMEKGLPISVLKVIQFSELNKHTVRFMRQILLAIIMNDDHQASLEVFHRISKPPKLHMFRESLRLFIQHFLVKNAGKKTKVLSEEEMSTLKERALEVDKILTMFESKLKL